jgi:flagellar basal body-associated protein FliL
MKKWLMILIIIVLLVVVGYGIMKLTGDKSSNGSTNNGAGVANSELDALANEASSAISSAKNAEASAPEFEGDLSIS